MAFALFLVTILVGLLVDAVPGHRLTIPEFDFPIIDVHVHLSNLSLLSYTWNIPAVRVLFMIV